MGGNEKIGGGDRSLVSNDICSMDLTIVDSFFLMIDEGRRRRSEEAKREDYFYQERHTTNMNYPFCGMIFMHRFLPDKTPMKTFPSKHRYWP